MDLKRIFDIFSRRNPQTEGGNVHLTDTFRNRVLMLCRDTLSNLPQGIGMDDYKTIFWEAIHKHLTYLLGKPQLSNDPKVHSRIDDTLAYLLGCPHEHFLAFIEYIFKLDFYWRICPDENQLVEQINHLFLIDQLPYALTPFVREKEIEVFYGTETEVYKIVSHPKVINRENEFAYSSLIQPTIKLLLDEGFSYANKEFIDALEDYRKGDYGDCLTKCASSFESTMKIICTRNHWHYNETDTASRLLHIVMEKSDLDSYFEQPLIITATIRNKLSTSHGSGTQLRKVPPSKVRFAINATAAAILLIVEHCYESSN